MHCALFFLLRINYADAGLGGAENGPARIAAALQECLMSNKEVDQTVYVLGTTSSLAEVPAPIRRCFTHELVQGTYLMAANLTDQCTISSALTRCRLPAMFAKRPNAISASFNLGGHCQALMSFCMRTPFFASTSFLTLPVQTPAFLHAQQLPSVICKA